MYSDNDASLHLQGKEAFTRARNKAFWSDIVNHLLGKPTDLWSFDEVRGRLRLRQEVYRGKQNVPLERIVGSVGRYHDFSNKFLPKKKDMADRWSRIYAKFNGMEGLPPVELYQIDDVYFVRDGNHRVSVARQMNNKTIEAYVTQLQTPIDLEPNMSSKAWHIAEAYTHFLEQTALNETRPAQKRIWLTEPSRYDDLLQHIKFYQDVLSERMGNQHDLRDAAAEWHDRVYAPAVTLMHKYDILRYTPKRTDADLYLWIVEHLYDIAAEHNAQPADLKLSEILMGFLAKQNIPVPQQLPYEDDAPGI